MTAAEWDSLCDGCGRCCLQKIKADDTLKIYSLDVACKILDTATGHCKDYPNRLNLPVICNLHTAENIFDLELPSTCAYRMVHEARDLEWWHPLVSGRAASVREAGISVAGRAIPDTKAGFMEFHTVDWPAQPFQHERHLRWRTAMFGGISACVPTFFDASGQIDRDLMADHCFWLLSNGCHSLAILDKTGEAATLTLRERSVLLEGLVERGVPPSKILLGIGTAGFADVVRVAEHAGELGIRGVLVSVAASGKMMPRDVIPDATRDLILRLPAALSVYLSFSVGHRAIDACLTAFEAFMQQVPERLTGIRDETAGCKLGLAALDRFSGSRFEVYTTDETMLGDLVNAGGSGLISPGANLLGRPCRQVIDPSWPAPGQDIHRAVETVSKALRSRPMVPALKALLARHLGRPGCDRVRLPLRPLRQAERIDLFRAFDAAGVKLRPPHL